MDTTATKLLIVPRGIPAELGLVADARVPGLIRIERPEAPSLVGTRRRACVAISAAAAPQRAELVAEPAADAAWCGGGRAVGRGPVGAREGVVGGPGGGGELWFCALAFRDGRQF